MVLRNCPLSQRSARNQEEKDVSKPSSQEHSSGGGKAQSELKAVHIARQIDGDQIVNEKQESRREIKRRQAIK